MKDKNISLRAWWLRSRQGFDGITTGGGEALSLPASIRHNLRWFWFDGLFSSASENILATYLVLYVLALGASRAQIGFLSSLSSLSAALTLLPGAILVERLGRRKQITMANGVIARLLILLLALVPMILAGPAAIYGVMALSVTRDAANNLPYPAWMSLTADLVPLSLRGRYFAAKNMAMGIAAMVVVFLVGRLITSFSGATGYQIALALAFALGVMALFSFSRLNDPRAHEASEKAESYSLRSLLGRLGSQPNFVAFCATAALWNFSLNIAGPFFNVYLVQNLKATAAQVGILSIVSTISGLAVSRKIGGLVDRWGPRRVQIVSMLLIPIMPVAWVFFRSPWHAAPLNFASGILWTAHGLASFNFLLDLTPEGQRARYSALFQIVVTVSLAIGAAVGGVIVTKWGYSAVFIGSGVGRMTAALLFARFVHSAEHVTKPAVATV